MKPISERALRRVVAIIERVENRELACDGPVGSTVASMTPDELRQVCRLLKKDVLSERVLRSAWMEAQKRRIREVRPMAGTTTHRRIKRIQADAREGMISKEELRPTIELIRQHINYWGVDWIGLQQSFAKELTRLETLLGEKEGK